MIRSLLRVLPAAALLWSALPTQAQDASALAVTNKLQDGGFEADRPSYWEPSGDGAEWSTDRSHSGAYSLKLSGSGAASWTQDEVIRNWESGFAANQAITLGAWVYAEGVNTAPASDDAKFQMVLTFRDADGNDALGQDIVLDVPQGAASTDGWVRVSTADLGEIIPQVEVKSVTAVVRKGASATGTVYVDDFFVTENTWHGANVDLPADWYTFWPSFGTGPEDPEWAVTKTTDESHSGDASLRIERLGTPDDVGGEAVAITERVPVTVGQPVLVSYWLKTENNASPAEIGTGDNNVGITALWYSSLESGAAGYNEIGGADIRLNGEYNPQVIPLLPRQADNGWTQYSFVLYPLENAVGMEVRLRYWHQFTGVTYWDDVVIADVDDVTMELPNLLSESAEGFEGDRPSYWEPSGDGAEWSTDRSHSGAYSLKLSGSGAASWTQDEVIRNWESGFAANQAITLGAWVYAEGVNTAPASDDAKFQMVLTFRDADGNDALGQDIVLDVPQGAASTDGWVRVSTADLGEIIPQVEVKSVTAVVRKGASATGTVYVDDFFVTENTWHGANVDLPADWYTFWPSFGTGPEDPEWAVTKTTEEAHTGDASVRIERLGSAADVGGEAVVITERVPAMPGEPMLVSYWLKTEGNASPAEIGTGDNNVGITALWYSSLESGAAGYNEIGGADIRLNGDYNTQVIPLLPRQADNGWTNYAFVLYPLENAVGMEVRLRYWHQFTGATYWDDVSITNIGGGRLFATASEGGPDNGGPDGARASWLRANAPNPFSARTEIRFTLPQAEDVTLEVYDLLGRRVALLADGVPMTADDHVVTFETGDVSSGTYLVVLRTPTHTEARRITVVR
ncbi:carbohydrate binding domain-containing protein [Rubrivirga sp.]|uniref:carbohydrate binding domain-containing protein n=1 Tax=Rubrivirga sp. TaxID=1885344 RepID=UPI003B51EEFF